MSKESYEREFNARASKLATELAADWAAFKARADGRVAVMKRDAADMQKRNGVSGLAPTIQLSFSQNSYYPGLRLVYNAGTNPMGNGRLDVS